MMEELGRGSGTSRFILAAGGDDDDDDANEDWRVC